jgi:hypothetical protein
MHAIPINLQFSACEAGFALQLKDMTGFNLAKISLLFKDQKLK